MGHSAGPIYITGLPMKMWANKSGKTKEFIKELEYHIPVVIAWWYTDNISCLLLSTCSTLLEYF